MTSLLLCAAGKAYDCFGYFNMMRRAYLQLCLQKFYPIWLQSYKQHAFWIKMSVCMNTCCYALQSLCSWSLVELYRALGSSVDTHKAVLAAHPMYANLMERALAKVVLQHVTTLEKFCQVPGCDPIMCKRLMHAQLANASSICAVQMPQACVMLAKVWTSLR